MRKRTIFCLAILINFCLATTVTAQVFVSPIPRIFVDSSAIAVRIKQLKAVEEKNNVEKQSRDSFRHFSSSAIKAKLVDSTTWFYIYKLPLDNMLCIIPTNSFHGNMPTMKESYSDAKQRDHNNMPNLFNADELKKAGTQLHTPLPQ